MNPNLNELLAAIKAEGVTVTLHPDRNKKPFRCPVCGGGGTVPRAMYDGGMGTDMTRASCKSCDGTGVLWG